MELPSFELMPLVVLGALVVGFVLKRTDLLKDKYNRFIPLIVSVVGILLACWIDGAIRPETIVYGALSGLASTGMHQAFTRLIGGNE
ncbi:phage holin family protein [Enterococcus hulanensis]|uniref:Phage holin family protein n=1 Tax=Enterococcus hulanensis TaxID=2559929 RepID=A0ABU3F6P3_9ENTE|nr:phage holin family protein [Enterococcus hulanensis]MDT2602616.1 phage holin family protein [Enterococcus hulanensis]MDT2612078.1 phage holin family protein [Enterococcus hulanensis]MDT2619212.1 phage holin family protein [Enterococcus hulanensis]MDT2630794.1 phage holin family protein [Enterococcus hulanensis]MDT2658227.1 phage holin family protein [Enterococcus hulanensis]